MPSSCHIAKKYSLQLNTAMKMMNNPLSNMPCIKNYHPMLPSLTCQRKSEQTPYLTFSVSFCSTHLFLVFSIKQIQYYTERHASFSDRYIAKLKKRLRVKSRKIYNKTFSAPRDTKKINLRV
ncbi:hypothetical protein PHYBLDRAFT_167207 [Phycomyces blakesleeanus NRRL 1555(-)]|uniref:Homeodomain-like DNA binding domain-containing transcription factor n=1 Tax=Phycomyces blakesleeanus (strain ATCC 8743b / DSM 1359 / FGSC 10004 / NBRC 33097 / NRRL 1555) TaxID=763407 RepID=A0A162XH92_PHYB8|nr:hypothetical protein PHYBLDRAFT_167207 [Phycomyces blakesleeanus NRRL 1555(-)]OAD74865.1 hypothetical protein PHYBLDRAFT_167207 [Phycomyces blakesleeanus NRRL 1555(-)]|eukprot:XP_018292905.1 hypothetical protein PHYBLDRAFT_167207 [Phycomyces blakesleeanus NRRL 1555(-)]